LAGTADLIKHYIRARLRAQRREFAMMEMTTMSTGMMFGMGVYHLVIVVFVALGIAASIKYLRSTTV